MSAPSAAGFGNAGKKAVHVKWAGKTIALGTFPAAEADEKCARAKALTRAWRSTMRPKPSRDWVMLELERLGVRVVSGRLGRKAGEEGEEAGVAGGAEKKAQVPALPVMGGAVAAVGERSNSIGWNGSDADLNNLMRGHGRRNSSLGLSMMNDGGRRGSLSSLGQAVGLEAGDPSMPPHRPLVGGGAAAAYEAARHDHFTQKSAEQQRRASSLGLGSLTGGGIGNMGMSVNPNQHYEMLKLHHMNLLNEIQETTLMMNLYQQQQLQQQQQQLQQQATAEHMAAGANDHGMAMLLQQQGGAGTGAQAGLDMFGSQLSQQQRQSLGLGSCQLGANFGAQQQMHMLQQQLVQQNGGGAAAAGAQAGAPQSGAVGAPSAPPQENAQNEDQPGFEGRIAQLKQDIARSEGGPAPDGDVARPADEAADNKRQADGDAGEPSPKRVKTEESQAEVKKEAEEEG